MHSITFPKTSCTHVHFSDWVFSNFGRSAEATGWCSVLSHVFSRLISILSSSIVRIPSGCNQNWNGCIAFTSTILVTGLPWSQGNQRGFLYRQLFTNAHHLLHEIFTILAYTFRSHGPSSGQLYKEHRGTVTYYTYKPCLWCIVD